MKYMSEGISAGWYPDPDDEGTSVRYWDGRAWTEQTRPADRDPEIPAGWYVDPDDGGISHRYWDGTDWTERTRPANRPRPTPAPAPQQTGMRPVANVNPAHPTPYPPSRTQGPRKRLGFLPDWRVFTYVILLVNLIFLIWIIAGAASTSGHATDCGTLTQQTCDNARNVGAGIGIGIIIFLWAAVDAILGIVWLVTRPNKRPCPVCGSNVRKGQTDCVACGYDFRSGAHPHAMTR